MDYSVIFNNENHNDGSFAHCYFNTRYGTWLAYGKSAYALRLLVKSAGDDNLRSYSKELDMPCSMVGDDTIKRLKKITEVYNEAENIYICLQLDSAINLDNYNNWKERLKDERNKRTEMWVDTPVSKYIPRGEYIADGMSGFARNSKRLMDMFVAFIAMIIFSPLFLITYICVKREDGGPAIFKQERIGRFGRPFYIYKFRSMRLDAEKFGPQLSHSGGDDDPRLTKVGKFIRAHHIDELPQLWNVFRGDMAFIGPRPERKFYIDKIMEYDARYEYLYQIRPGVTSYATLYNGYTDTMEKMLRRLEFDLYYLRHRSWWFDFKILFYTFCSIVFGKKF
ncbi:MAG: sugar transferase [Alistipes sp.]|nr:sugar transferase [Alistipes sp.]